MVSSKSIFRFIIVFLFSTILVPEQLSADPENNNRRERESLDSIFTELEASISVNNDSISELTYSYIRKCQSINYEAGIAKGYYVLGKSNIVGSFNYPQAFDYIYRAQRIFEKDSLANESAKCSVQLGLINYLQRNFTDAEEYFQSAMKTFAASGDTIRWRRTAYLSSLCASENHMFRTSDRYLSIAEKFKNYGNDGSGEREYNYGRGIYFARQNLNDSAIKYFLLAVNRFNPVNDPVAIQLFNGEIAQAYYNMGQFKAARDYAEKVVKIGYLHNSARGIVQSHYLLYKLYSKDKKYKEALDHLGVYVDIMDSIVNEKKTFELASIKSKYEIASAEQDNILKMAQQTALQESQVQKQRFLKNLFILGCFFFVSLIVFLVYTNNLKKRKNAALANSLDKLKATQEQLIRQEKLASMGKLSAGIAHEIRNPINFITNFSELSEELLNELSYAKTDEERSELIATLIDSMQKIKLHGKRADGIVKSMLDHSRSKSPERAPCNINLLFESHLSMALKALRLQNSSFQCTVNSKCSPDLPEIKIVAADIGRVFLNIFSNAFHAMEEKMKLNLPGYKPVLNIATSLHNGKIKLVIEDNGNGIPDKIKDQIFEPFFTTKPTGHGTGLGLSISNEIIKAHNGEMIVESNSGEFTRFTILL